MTAQRERNFLGCIARLKSGVSMAQAQANMDTISATPGSTIPRQRRRISACVSARYAMRSWVKRIPR